MADQTPFPPVSPHLVVSDASAAIDFYRRAFGAVEVLRHPAPDDKRLLHAEVTINGGMVMLMDDFPEHNDGKSSAPEALSGTPVIIHLQLDDVYSVWQQALDAGATVVMPLENQFWGDRYGQLADPFGHRWSLATKVGDPKPDKD